MAEPLTLALVGTFVLKEGIKFLYGQAGELLKRWRERKDVNTEAQSTFVPVDTQGDIFEGALAPLKPNFDQIEPLAGTMRELWSSLSPYAQGIDDVEVSDEELLKNHLGLRPPVGVETAEVYPLGGRERPTAFWWQVTPQKNMVHGLLRT